MDFTPTGAATCSDPRTPADRGRTWHSTRCIRYRWSRDVSIPFKPSDGDRVQILAHRQARRAAPLSPDVARKWYVYRGTRWMPEEQLREE